MPKPKGNKKSKYVVGNQAKEVLKNLDENNPVIKLFKEYSVKLDEKHDRYERIIKISRDITIESKRIIFLLHSINADYEERKKSVLKEAETRLHDLCTNNFKIIAIELKELDGYLYHRAFTNGMQEFLEALCFFQFITTNAINSWKMNKKFFNYEENDMKFNLLFTQNDFILGIADFTGELMRKCINSLGSGNVEECFKICNYVRNIHTGFLGLSYERNKEISRKSYVLKQSLSKMELVCYNIRIRGSEIPQHMLLNVIESQDNNVDINETDEGYSM